MIYEQQILQYLISTDKQKLDTRLIHQILKTSYWSPGIPYKTVLKSIKHSLCFGMYDSKNQIGFARLVTDYTSFSYLADVFIVVEKRGSGLSKFLLRTILNHPEIKSQRRLMLATYDAHKLYEQFGFKSLEQPEIFMQKVKSAPFKLVN